MPGRLTRIAVTGLAATLVGCIVAPRGTEPPAPGGPAAVSPDGARAVSLPGVPFGSGEVDKSRVAYVTFTIGSPRQVQDIPAGTKAIGISLKSASGTNLIKSAKCGSDNFCYKPGIGMAMFAYTSGSTFDVTVEVSLTELPVTKSVKASAYAYENDINALFDTASVNAATVVAQGQSAAFDLSPGGTSNATVIMVKTAAAGSAPELTAFYPAMGGPDQEITITGTSFGTRDFTASAVKIATESMSITAWGATAITAKIPMSDAASASIDNKPIAVTNKIGTTTFSTNFTYVSTISVPALSNLAAPTGTLTVTSAGSNSANVEIAGGVQAVWTLEKVGVPGASPTPTGGGGGNCNVQPPATPPPGCGGAGTSPTPGTGGTPTPAPTPTVDANAPVLEWTEDGTTKTGTTTGSDYPKSVKILGKSAGTYRLKAKSGNLEAAKSLTIQ